MANIILTDASPIASIPTSNSGCIVSGPDIFYCGFGATEPTEWVATKINEAVSYSGEYGLLWVKKIVSGSNLEIKYFAAI